MEGCTGKKMAPPYFTVSVVYKMAKNLFFSFTALVTHSFEVGPCLWDQNITRQYIENLQTNHSQL